jgi:hypothetical protein
MVSQMVLPLVERFAPDVSFVQFSSPPERSGLSPGCPIPPRSFPAILLLPENQHHKQHGRKGISVNISRSPKKAVALF